MRRRGAFFPNFFLEAVGVSETRPAWFIMLLAAMATAAVWAGAWVAFFALLQSTPGWTGEKFQLPMFLLMFLLFWAISVSWYHVIYLWGLRKERYDEPATETRWEVWGSLPFMIILFIVKIMWVIAKYAIAPFIPMIIADGLRSIPTVGGALANVAIIVVVAYPLIALALYALWRLRAKAKSKGVQRGQA